jgi:GNAT superfamily N-acetyltransferase
MEAIRIEFEPFIDEEERRFIVNGVDNFNIAATRLPDYFPINFVLRGERDDVLGGVLGQLWGGWLHVTYLWVAEKARGAGYGTRLMQNAEAYAQSRGAVGRPSRHTASGPGHFMSDLATKCSARWTSILLGTPNSS